MKAAKYQILRMGAVLILLADGTLLAAILIWLIGNGGVVGCGQGVFDDPNWPLSVLVLVGIPGSWFVGMIVLIRSCSQRITAARAKYL